VTRTPRAGATRVKPAKPAASRPRPRRAVPSSKKPRPVPQREQDLSTFAQILDRLVRNCPGAAGAALVDSEGETVDWAGHFDPFELKVTAAHWQIVLTTIATEQPALGDIRQITVRGRTRSYVVRKLQEAYAVVLVVHRHAAFAVSERALEEADARLGREAGWPPRKDAAPWRSADIETELEDKSRPARMLVSGTWHPVEVMGAMVGLRPGERGYRVRLPTGVEMMLVRERHGSWFADEAID
jgi:predicted regulator of Ras-like GTPase activity (Roadblock/LC7/MglB family)